MTPEEAVLPNPSAWKPLRHTAFRTLWIAALVSNIGMWMQNVAAVWLMIAIAPSPFMVAMVQTATSLPIFLIALPAGALADIVDRRKMLIVTQIAAFVVAIGLTILTYAGDLNAWVLLLFTFLLGLGSALYAPAWQASISELVPPEDLPSAVALGGASVNVARAVGPALGGVLIAASGPGLVFLINALSFIGIIIALARWKSVARESALPAEHLLGALRAGLRYTRHSPPFKGVLIRAGAFIVCGSVVSALLPIVAKNKLGLDAAGLGVLLGCIGVGAVGGVLLLPRVRQRVSSDQLMMGASIVFSLSVVGLGFIRALWLLVPTMTIGGAAWITIVMTLNVTAQQSVPSWVRARAVGIYLLVFQGGMAIGSIVWGALASATSVRIALAVAAIGTVSTLALKRRWQLSTAEGLNLAPSMYWPDPELAMEPSHQNGPVLVTVEYRVAPENEAAFQQAMNDSRMLRRRDGAYRWGIYRDIADPELHIEVFLVESWAEHLRQHERLTMEDEQISARARAFHIGQEPPKVSHLIYAK